MDPRHESLEQELLNDLINLLNQYIQEQTDELLEKPELCKELKEIADYIYSHVKLNVEVDEIFSKKNFLSIDIVPLPFLGEEMLMQAHSPKDPQKIIKATQTIMANYADSYLHDAHHEINNILRKYN